MDLGVAAPRAARAGVQAEVSGREMETVDKIQEGDVMRRISLVPKGTPSTGGCY